MKTDKPDVESKSDEKCEKPLPNDLNNQKAKPQTFVPGADQSISKDEISTKESQYKAYWKKKRYIHQERKLKQ